MSSRFYAISIDEMHEFLTKRGFQKMTLPNHVELVYGKIIHHHNQKFSLRIITAINPNGESRAKGTDAIRVQLAWMYEGQPQLVGRMQSCLRVKNWRNNLQAAIDRATDIDHLRLCPKCGSPLVIREGQFGEFWGCVTWHQTKCTGKVSNLTPAE